MKLESSIRFLMGSLGTYPVQRVVVIDKLKSYKKPIKNMCSSADHRSHKGLNNRAENSHQPTRRREKISIKFKSPNWVQNILSLMGKVRNIFAIDVGRYTKKAPEQRLAFQKAKSIWNEATMSILYA